MAICWPGKPLKPKRSNGRSGKMQEHAKPITVTGIVSPHDWGADDRIIAVAIATSGELEYVVTDEDVVNQLIQHIHEMVEVTGTVVHDETGNLHLSPKDFTVLDDADLDNDDYDWDDEDDDEWDDEDDDCDTDDRWSVVDKRNNQERDRW